MASAGELIRKYVEHSDQGAFTELVRLHVNLVYSVALRQAYGDTALAEDITQEVFALMARKAPELANRPTLTGWLYRSALLVTNSTIRREQRRKVHEHRAYLEATMMNSETTGPAGQGIWGDAKPALDRAMGHLSERERDALADFTWVHTFSPNVLLTTSPFFHFNRANYDGDPNTVPVSTTQHLDSTYNCGSMSRLTNHYHPLH